MRPFSRPRRRLAYRFTTWLIDCVLSVFARRHYRIAALPPDGPLLVAPNHVSVIDPLYVAAALTRAGRTPRFVITAGVLRSPVIGAVLRFFDHIPLDRRRGTDPALLDPARLALQRGECVVLYPEGAVTTDPEFRPGRPLPGLGVLASELGVPVLPVAQWGAQHVLGRVAPLAWRAWPPRRADVVVEALPLVTPPPPAGLIAARRFTGELLDAVGERVEALRRDSGRTGRWSG